MCIICAGLRPWSPSCDHAALAEAEPAGGALSAASGSAGRAAPPVLTPEEIGARLIDAWGAGAPRRLDARAGDTLTVDVSALSSEGRALARSALAEWSAVTGLQFEEMKGFKPTLVRREGSDAPASTATTAALRQGEAFDGRITAGDRDWVRLDLPGSTTARIVVEGVGEGALRNPALALFDALGREIPLGVHYAGGKAEITVATTQGGGSYYAEVAGLDRARGDYRLSLMEPGGAGTARIAFGEARPGAHATFALAGDRILSAEVNVGADWLARHGTGLASYSFQTYLHEIGHALGLGHPGDYSASARFDRDATFANDSWQTSVMSYFSQSQNPHVAADRAFAVTPMSGDIEAVRALYGGTEVRPGDTVYGENSNAGGMLGRVASLKGPVAFTIADTGGRDTIDLSSQRAAQRLDLTPGAVSDVFGHKGNLVIAQGTVIEDALLGRGSDDVTGNDAANLIRGGAGHDLIRGRGGNDHLYGGSGDDRIWGDAGHDRIWGEGGDDRLYGGEGHDAIWGGDGDDRIWGDAGNDRLYGGAGRDQIWGGAGDDVIDGGAGDDQIWGGSGDDVIDGGAGKDRLWGGSGKDEIRGGAGNDQIWGGSGNDRIWGGSGHDRIDGGPGHDRLTGGAGRDVFVFSGRFGRDVITDFSPAEDRIDLGGVSAIRDWRDLRANHLGASGRDALIEADAGSSILLLGIKPSDLGADHFLF